MANLLAHGKPEGLEAVRKNMQELGADADNIIQGTGTLLASTSTFGDLLRCELVEAKSISGVAGEYCYVMQWDLNTYLVRFRWYNPGMGWILEGLNGDGNPIEMFAKVAVESGKSPDPPQTAALPRARRGRR